MLPGFVQRIQNIWKQLEKAVENEAEWVGQAIIMGKKISQYKSQKFVNDHIFW